MNRGYLTVVALIGLIVLVLLGLLTASVVQAFEARNEAVEQERRIELLSVEALRERDAQISGLVRSLQDATAANGALVSQVNALREQLLERGAIPLVPEAEPFVPTFPVRQTPVPAEPPPAATEPAPEPSATTDAPATDEKPGKAKGHDKKEKP